MSNLRRLTNEELAQAVIDGSGLPVVSWVALKSGIRFLSEQKQELVNRIARDPRFAKLSLQDVKDLTDSQKAKLWEVSK